MNIVKKSLFLTGGTGFIGGGILQHFIKQNWSVTAHVRDAAKSAGLRDLGVNLLEGDLESKDFIDNNAKGFDAYVHTAFKPGDKDFLINTTKWLLESAVETSKLKEVSFIFCGGCLTNGDNDVERDESIRPDQPLNGATWKVELEDYIVSLDKSNENIRTAVIRPSWVYGNNASNYMNNYLRLCKDNNEVVTYGVDTNNMIFIHVNDCAEYFYLVVTKRVGGIFNATDNVYIPSKKFVEALAAYLKVDIVKKEIDNYFKVALTINQRIITRRADEIGFKPKYSNFIDNIDQVYKELYTN